MPGEDHVPIGLREFFEQLFRERDRFYMERFDHLETQINALESKLNNAVIAIKEATASTFAASEKAITKSEEAQRELNVKNNEFRGQLKDQADVLISRSEALTKFANIEDKIGSVRTEFDAKLALSTKDIPGLRDSRSGVEGQAKGVQLSVGMIIAVLTGLSLILGIITAGLVLARLRS